jgi:sarcosine oxidase
VTRQVLYWFAADPIAVFEPGRFPVFIWEPAGLPEGIYGFPAIDGASGGVKVAPAAYGDRMPTADAPRRPVTAAEVAATHRDLVAPCFPGLGPTCLRTATCLYTVTPDSGFVIDRHAAMPQVVLVSPCSGHGFKHSAAIGEAVAELVTEGRSRLDLTPFGLARFEGSPIE